jgi:hypothetical protein
MISKNEAQRHVMRMSGLRDFPEHVEAIEELVDAVMRASGNSEHGKRIADSICQNSKFCPTPADIYEIAVHTHQDDDPREWRCAVCDGTSWETVYELHTWAGEKKTVERISKERYEFLRDKVSGHVGEQVVTTAMIRCVHCKLGRKRKEAEGAERARRRAA